IVMRVSPAGEGFVLYQIPKREVTAVAVARDGSIYAAGVGNKQITPVPTPAPTTSSPTPIPVNNPGAPASPTLPSPAAPPPASVSSPTVSGGSDVYRIEPNGNPSRIWNNTQDVVYAITFDASGRAVLGAGNRGNVYRIESPTTYTALLTVPATQVTAFQ